MAHRIPQKDQLVRGCIVLTEISKILLQGCKMMGEKVRPQACRGLEVGCIVQTEQHVWENVCGEERIEGGGSCGFPRGSQNLVTLMRLGDAGSWHRHPFLW